MAVYDTIGRTYTNYRLPDPRIAGAIEEALGDARSIANIGAGAGSYEPAGRSVIGVEPSEVMIRQRPAGAAPCLQGTAEALPLESKSADAAMAVLTMHHWSDLEGGLREMARVARRRIVLVTWVPDGGPFWLTRDYFPEIFAYDTTVFPAGSDLMGKLERFAGPARMKSLSIPHDCRDGMLAAYWRRPELYLEADRRRSMSSFSRIDAEPGVTKLRADLASGRWGERNRGLLPLDSLDVGYRIVICEVGTPTH
ncbi:MAG: class I SAM-dependent methyltransferase [Phycisphaerales bacterium]